MALERVVRALGVEQKALSLWRANAITVGATRSGATRSGAASQTATLL